jgi:hypothetical protein
MRLSVCVSHCSTFVLRTMVGGERGAKACAEAGSRLMGIAARESDVGTKYYGKQWRSQLGK